MAEIKTGIFAKNVQKRLSRAQEKVLQKLGKADETKDEQFEQCVQNFKQQESEGTRLQREMKTYIAAVKGMQQASMNLTESLHEVYEPDWHGKDDVLSMGKNCDALWEDFHQKLVDSTIIALDTYLTQFPDLKMRVAKRSRKLIDYDSARHHLETLQTSTVRNEKKISKAEEDLKKAQKVFDDLNVDLQDELPTLWDSRVGFYVNIFKSVSSLEAKFHKEISFLCHKLYEVMNKLAEQHSDKMFTIQGAPSDSGPLRLARTPTPPEDESPEDSPAVSPNHTLRPTSPGPPRPKSPSQFKMGPPKPPPPKVTPTKEVAQEQIISLFDGGFPEISVTSPQPNEKPGESLLDLDFDPFKPDSNTPIGQAQSPTSQALPWDLWTANAEAQPAPDAGFTANWTADFASAAGTGAEDLEEDVQPAADGQGWPPVEGWPKDTVAQGEPATGEVRCWNTEHNQEPNPDSYPYAVGIGGTEHQQQGQKAANAGLATYQPEWDEGEQPVWCLAKLEERGTEQPMPGIIFTDEFGQEVPEASGQGLYTSQHEGDNSKWYLSSQGEVDGSGSDYETAEEWGDVPGQNGGWISADDELETAENERPNAVSNQAVANSGLTKNGFVDWSTGHTALPFSEQSIPANVDFGSNAFSVSWDQADVTEPVKSNEVTEHLVSSIKDSEEQKESIDSLFGSDPFSTSESDPFENDPFATSTGCLFGTGRDPFANSDKDAFGHSESDASELPKIDASVPFLTSEGDFFGPIFLNTEGQTIGFASDPFVFQSADDTNDIFANVASQDPFSSETTKQDPFLNEDTRDPFASKNTHDLFASEATQYLFESDPTKDSFAYGTNQDPISSETSQELFSSVTSQDPFAIEGFQDSFASDTKQDTFFNETIQDLFVSKSHRVWAGRWETESAGEAGEEGMDSGGQSNRFAQWAAFPPPDADRERFSKGSWQEVSGSSGFFSFDGQGDFIAGWPGESCQTKDQCPSFPGQNDIHNQKTTAAEIPAGLKEPENSDLSEDEVANRRYGKLYQEIDTEKDEVFNEFFNGSAQVDASAAAFVVDFGKMSDPEAHEGAEVGADVSPEAGEAPAPVAEAGVGGPVTTPPEETTTETTPPAETAAVTNLPDDTVSSTEEFSLATEAAELMEESAPVTEAGEEPTAEPLASAEEKESPIEVTPTIETKPVDASSTVETMPEDEADTIETKPEDEAGTIEPKPEDETGTIEPKPEDAAGTVEPKTDDEAGTVENKPEDEAGTVVMKTDDETSKDGATNNVGKEEKMPIPSVVIEPASSNEGDDDRDGDIASPTATSGGMTSDQTAKDIPSGMPAGFMFKVETMHDFDAANPDELELKRGDIVLVVPTELVEDQDAGWLTGIKESEWLQGGASAQKGLFPENFTQRVG